MVFLSSDIILIGVSCYFTVFIKDDNVFITIIVVVLDLGGIFFVHLRVERGGGRYRRRRTEQRKESNRQMKEERKGGSSGKGAIRKKERNSH
jgi:hypothetical protein